MTRPEEIVELLDHCATAPGWGWGPVTSWDVHGYSEMSWQLIANAVDCRRALSEVRPISEEDRRAVVRILAAREQGNAA